MSGGLTVAEVLGVDLGQLDPGAYSISGAPPDGGRRCDHAAAYAFSAYAPLAVAAADRGDRGAGDGRVRLVFERGFGIAWASASAALLLGLVSYPVAGRVRVPSLVVVAAGIMPLLPGLSIYRGLALLADGRQRGAAARWSPPPRSRSR